MDKFLECIEKYELLLELILTATSLLISVLVVIQTKNLAKRQAKQEKSIADQQNDLQKRQIRLELFERKLKIKECLSKIFETNIYFYYLKDRTVEHEDVFWDFIKEILSDVDTTEYSIVLNRAKYVFEESLYDDIHFLNQWFQNVHRLAEFMSLENGFRDEFINSIKKQVLDDTDRIKNIELTLMERIEKDLDISRLDK